MLKIYSKETLLREIHTEIINKQIYKWKDNKYISDELKLIFKTIISDFINYWFSDRRSKISIKKLENEVYELRSRLSEKHLLRIIFYYKENEIILSTGYLIKEDKWDYKKGEEKHINNLYKKEIVNAYTSYENFSKNKNWYIFLNSYFNLPC